MSMQRREVLKSVASAGLFAAATPLVRSQEQLVRVGRGMPAPRIKDISVIECQPAGVRLTVVKVTTDQDGLYGYGCATFTQRADLVRPAVADFRAPDRLHPGTRLAGLEVSTPTRKIAILAEQFGVRTAWHGPGDVSPVGHMANVTLDIVSDKFGIQEHLPFNERTQEIFRGCPEMKDGFLWVC